MESKLNQVNEKTKINQAPREVRCLLLGRIFSSPGSFGVEIMEEILDLDNKKYTGLSLTQVVDNFIEEEDSKRSRYNAVTGYDRPPKTLLTGRVSCFSEQKRLAYEVPVGYRNLVAADTTWSAAFAMQDWQLYEKNWKTRADIEQIQRKIAAARDQSPMVAQNLPQISFFSWLLRSFLSLRLIWSGFTQLVRESRRFARKVYPTPRESELDDFFNDPRYIQGNKFFFLSSSNLVLSEEEITSLLEDINSFCHED